MTAKKSITVVIVAAVAGSANMTVAADACSRRSNWNSFPLLIAKCDTVDAAAGASVAVVVDEHWGR